MKNNQNLNSWQENYCKEFGVCGLSGKCQCKRELKFISNLLKEQEAELEKEFEKILANKKAHSELREKLVIQEVKKDVKAQLLERLEKEMPKEMKRKSIIQGDIEHMEFGTAFGFNQALSETKDLINKIKNEK